MISNSKVINTIVGIVCIAIPLVTGMISARIAGDQMQSFGELNQPPLSPPAWLFPVAWTILYILMGITLLLIVRSSHEYTNGAILLFIAQLILNFLWSPAFFVEKNYLKALVMLALMLIFTILLTALTWRINKYAAVLLMPYIAWMCFASYLNTGVWILN